MPKPQQNGLADVNTFLIKVRGVDLGEFKATYYKPLGRPNRQCRSSQGSVGFGRRPFTKCRSEPNAVYHVFGAGKIQGGARGHIEGELPCSRS